MKKGFSLIEMLVVISVFAVIGILTTTSIALTLRSSKKSDSLVRVRENVNYTLAVIERQIRNAEEIPICTGEALSGLIYISIEGNVGLFSCIAPTSESSGYIASGSARLTSSDISIVNCSFTCIQTVNNPAIIKVNITAEDITSTGAEKGSVTAQTEIVVRNY